MLKIKTGVNKQGFLIDRRSRSTAAYPISPVCLACEQTLQMRECICCIIATKFYETVTDWLFFPGKKFSEIAYILSIRPKCLLLSVISCFLFQSIVLYLIILILSSIFSSFFHEFFSFSKFPRSQTRFMSLRLQAEVLMKAGYQAAL